MKSSYDDIIQLPRHISKKRPKMALINRAAQFSPFAALAGHEEAIEETAIVTEERVELDEYVKCVLSEKLQIIAKRIKEQPKISITFFQPDSMKKGGSYITTVGQVKKIKEHERLIVMADGIEIPMDEIISIDGQIFEV